MTHTAKRINGNNGHKRAREDAPGERKGRKTAILRCLDGLPVLRNQQVVCSSHISSSKKKDICFQQMSFFLGFGRLSRPKPSGILMLAVGRAAPAQFSAAGREFTRRSAHGPEGPDRRCISSNSPKAKNIDFNRSLQNETGLVETSRNSF